MSLSVPPADRPVVPIQQALLTHHVFVCGGTACSANNSPATMAALKAELAKHGLLYTKPGKGGSLTGRVLVTECGSVGLCAVGPAVLVYPDGAWYQGITPEQVPALVKAHWLNGPPMPTEYLALSLAILDPDIDP
jgi:(2Fe-2S) ferredoxin